MSTSKVNFECALYPRPERRGLTALSDKQPTAEETVELPRQPHPTAPCGEEQGDDRYPGSFFRIPAPPVLGKTGWSLS